MNRIFGRLFTVFVSASIPASAGAANFVCTASPVIYLAAGGDGTIYTAVDGKVVGICNLGSQVGGVSSQACTGWYSALLTQRSLGKTVTLQFDNPGLSGCAAIGAWTVTVPYFLIQN